MRQKDKGHPSWTDKELETAVEVYLYLLKLERDGTKLPTRQVEEIAGKGGLQNRNSSSIRYRLRNISFVFEQRGLPTLIAYSPAPAVGKNVRRRIEDILDRSNEFLFFLVQPKKNRALSELNRSNLVDDLDKLKQSIEKFSQQNFKASQLGHNNPPDDMRLNEFGVENVIDAISSIQSQLERKNTDEESLSGAVKIVAQFGVECILWARDRITDFCKAAAIAAGTAYGVSTASKLPHEISDVIEKIGAYFF